ncbi:unnamed protein product [Zymoseptoria tritici ST99CH_1A5]|uniref:Uncharacterized protein n=2 Tax=Zymoseptoria tritici TaxID=1047171 RepID=A0A2H1GZL6_ZYMTR|nr:unnamed protein product [Zymoseptoria tritici ST99CH_1E4]SMR62867.1 unnamed protein product [Zymoseptoria tritici ST99CH_3D1]SMY28236.1 unnamed protein product [Zymoseptoria tritici ST99CH_1A5]
MPRQTDRDFANCLSRKHNGGQDVPILRKQIASMQDDLDRIRKERDGLKASYAKTAGMQADLHRVRGERDAWKESFDSERRKASMWQLRARRLGYGW